MTYAAVRPQIPDGRAWRAQPHAWRAATRSSARYRESCPICRRHSPFPPPRCATGAIHWSAAFVGYSGAASASVPGFSLVAGMGAALDQAGGVQIALPAIR